MSLLYTSKQFIKYWFNAKCMHGVHSPFAYTFNKNILCDTRKFYAFNQIESLRNNLKLNNTEIEIEDYGAGSTFHKNKVCTISSLVNNAAKQKLHAQWLFKIINTYNRKNILELGTSLGIGTSYMAMANAAATITTIEGSKNIATIAQQNFNALNINNINIVHGNFDTVLQDVCKNNKPFDLVFIDGNHQYHPTLNYLETILPYVTPDAIIIFDDIYWSADMTKAWKKIKADNRFLLTIDVFQLGIVALGNAFKQKQHFVLRPYFKNLFA